MKKSKIQSILIFILFAISIGLGISYYNLSQTNLRMSENKNITFKWSPGEEILTGFWKSNNKMSDQSIDKNFDLNFEIINLYNTSGILVQRAYDKNENSVYEKGQTFNVIGEVVGSYQDTDEDGAVDRFTLVLDNEKKLEFIDEDIDGRYEKVIVTDKNGNTTSELEINSLFKEH